MQVGDDEFGYMLSDILKQNNVNNQGLLFDAHARTALAFVTLEVMVNVNLCSIVIQVLICY